MGKKMSKGRNKYKESFVDDDDDGDTSLTEGTPLEHKQSTRGLLGPSRYISNIRQSIGSVIERKPTRRRHTKRLDVKDDADLQSSIASSNGKIPPSSPSEVAILRNRFIKENSSATLADVYDVDTESLGFGTHGSVYRGVNVATGQERAIKAIPKSSVMTLVRFRNEISLMKNLDHPNIVKLFETFEDEFNIFLCMELCSGGELFDRIIEVGYFTEQDAATFMKQIFSGVHYLHACNIMHRDLKPENFLLLNKHDTTLKIIDFGLSCRFGNGLDTSKTKAGTPYYVAPQVLQGLYDKACDYWSCGVVMYILLCGYPPFYGETDQEVLSKVKAAEYSLVGREWKKVSSDAKDLISHLLKYHPQERFTAEEALLHPWISKLPTLDIPVPLSSTLMTNLRTFRNQGNLKKAALTVIASHLSEKEVENLKGIFFTLDTDNSGTLSIQEMVQGLQRLGRTEVPPDFLTIVQEVDSDGSGYIDYTEFLAATIDRKLYLREDILFAAFRVFDLDGDGKISRDELRSLMLSGADNSGCSEETSSGQEAINNVLHDADLDGDGLIDFEEFSQMMRRGSSHKIHAYRRKRFLSPQASQDQDEESFFGKTIRKPRGRLLGFLASRKWLPKSKGKSERKEKVVETSPTVEEASFASSKVQ